MSASEELRSVDYEPAGEPSLFARWERDEAAAITAPLAVRDPDYRQLVVDLLEPHRRAGARLLSVGAGNGFAEAALQQHGWDVLATDRAQAAVELCSAKGLRARRFDLLTDPPAGRFEALYCDGVLGHLWRHDTATSAAWAALAKMATPHALCLVSNDLADDDTAPTWRVRSAEDASFYRPPSDWFARDAAQTGRWAVVLQHVHSYLRAGEPRRRELVVARLLVDDRVVAQGRE